MITIFYVLILFTPITVCQKTVCAHTERERLSSVSNGPSSTYNLSARQSVQM